MFFSMFFLSFLKDINDIISQVSKYYESRFNMKKFTRFLDVPIVFSAGGFDEKLKFAENSKKNVKLLTLEDL